MHSAVRGLTHSPENVKLVFIFGAALEDHANIFNAELESNESRGIDFFEADFTVGQATRSWLRSE